MTQNVDKEPVRINDEEAPDTPVLVTQRVRDLQALLYRAGVNRVDVFHFNADVGPRCRRLVAALDEELSCRVTR